MTEQGVCAPAPRSSQERERRRRAHLTCDNRMYRRTSAPACVGHELHQRSIRIAEVDAGAAALGAEALHRAGFDLDAVALQVRDSVGDRTSPLEAEVAVARLHRQPRHLGRLDARPVHVELLVAEPVREAGGPRYQLGAEHVAIERIRALPLGDMDDTVIEPRRQCHDLGHDVHPLSRISRPFSRSQVRFFSVSRLSCSFLPRASATSTLARPLSLKYIFSGTIVMPSRSTPPASLSIWRRCSSSLRGRFGAWLKRLACTYSGMLALTSQISPSRVSA